MPPQLPVFADPTRAAKTVTSSRDVYTNFPKVFILALAVVIALWIAIVRHLSKRKKVSTRDFTATPPEKHSDSHQKILEKDLRHCGSFGGQDDKNATSFPLYPWTSPPQLLPGPYDPRLYPLPTLRRHSYDPSAENIHASKKSAEVSYTRRVSLNGIPKQQSTLHGTVVISSKGWRRNQWIVSGE